jgi:Xaa-Pro aminopeptidase
MQQYDIDLLNAYHKAVFEKVSPLIKDQAIVDWLKEQTRPISK